MKEQDNHFGTHRVNDVKELLEKAYGLKTFSACVIQTKPKVGNSGFLEEQGELFYNYRVGKFTSEEAPGISVFLKNEQGDVFHTYSCYSRGLDMLNGAYHYMYLVSKGRDEDGLPYSMAWPRRHDQYGD